LPPKSSESSQGGLLPRILRLVLPGLRVVNIKPPGGDSVSDSTANEATAMADEGTKQPAPKEPHRPTADIQAILDVLRRAQARVPEEYRTPLDLHEADLRGADLQRANLQRANLQRANLIGANFPAANLIGARGLTEEQIEWTIGSNETDFLTKFPTELPEGLNRPQLWSKSIEEQTKIVQERLREH
jgi:hypothetical protein